jgi:hypothetical protein
MARKDFRRVVGGTTGGCSGKAAIVRLALTLLSPVGGSGAVWGVYAEVDTADVGVSGGRDSEVRMEGGSRVLGNVSASGQT